MKNFNLFLWEESCRRQRKRIGKVTSMKINAIF